MSTPMPPMPDRNAPPADGGAGLFNAGQQPPPDTPADPNADLGGKLQLFRSADEAFNQIARVYQGPEIEQIKALLKQAMMAVVASQRTSTTDNPRILGV